MKMRQSMRGALRRAILERILRGRIAAGDRIKESQLARELGASRTPLREVLFALEQDGLVRSELDRGFLVEPLSAREVREVYPILWTLEGLAVRASVPVIYSLQDQLKELNSKFSAAVRPRRAHELDTLWHETLVSLCPNERLKHILLKLRVSIQRYEHLYMQDLSLIQESVRQHKSVMHALRMKDIDQAVSALTDNWRFGMQVLLIQLGES